MLRSCSTWLCLRLCIKAWAPCPGWPRRTRRCGAPDACCPAQRLHKRQEFRIVPAQGAWPRVRVRDAMWPYAMKIAAPTDQGEPTTLKELTERASHHQHAVHDDEKGGRRDRQRQGQTPALAPAAKKVSTVVIDRGDSDCDAIGGSHGRRACRTRTPPAIPATSSNQFSPGV